MVLSYGVLHLHSYDFGRLHLFYAIAIKITKIASFLTVKIQSKKIIYITQFYLQ
jgi:hypothetical protein